MSTPSDSVTLNHSLHDAQLLQKRWYLCNKSNSSARDKAIARDAAELGWKVFLDELERDLPIVFVLNNAERGVVRDAGIISSSLMLYYSFEKFATYYNCGVSLMHVSHFEIPKEI